MRGEETTMEKGVGRERVGSKEGEGNCREETI